MPCALQPCRVSGRPHLSGPVLHGGTAALQVTPHLVFLTSCCSALCTASPGGQRRQCENGEPAGSLPYFRVRERRLAWPTCCSVRRACTSLRAACAAAPCVTYTPACPAYVASMSQMHLWLLMWTWQTEDVRIARGNGGNCVYVSCLHHHLVFAAVSDTSSLQLLGLQAEGGPAGGGLPAECWAAAGRGQRWRGQ